MNYTVILTGLSYFTRFELFLNFSTVVGFGGASDTVMNRTSEHGKRINGHISLCNVHMDKSILEQTKQNLRKTAFEKFEVIWSA